MAKKRFARMTVDVLMTASLLLLMAYSLVGEAAHEWIGIAMLVLFITHHVLNGRWCRSLFKGRYTPFRVLETVLVPLLTLCMAGSAVSGVILSKHALAFLPIRSGRAWARIVHLLCAYWGFVLMGLHLGLHWNSMLARFCKSPISNARKWTLRCLGLGVTLYGAVAFVKRNIPNYLLLRDRFVYFDFEASRAAFFLDYIAVMGLFVWLGHYLAAWLRGRNNTKQEE